MDYEEIEKNRWKDFDEKIDSLKEHPKYEWLRKYANDAKSFYDGFGYYQIKAEDFVERIKAATVEQIREWLDGKHGLEWNLLKENKQ